jgi:Na+-translocating ferredoxin:NAD+ oxidoreductase RnfA subunit
MRFAAQLIDTDALLNVVWVSFAAAIGGTIAFIAALVGATRFAELRREGRSPVAGLYAALGVAGGLVFVGAAVLGVVVMIDK